MQLVVTSWRGPYHRGPIKHLINVAGFPTISKPDLVFMVITDMAALRYVPTLKESRKASEQDKLSSFQVHYDDNLPTILNVSGASIVILLGRGAGGDSQRYPSNTTL